MGLPWVAWGCHKVGPNRPCDCFLKLPWVVKNKVWKPILILLSWFGNIARTWKVPSNLQPNQWFSWYFTLIIPLFPNLEINYCFSLNLGLWPYHYSQHLVLKWTFACPRLPLSCDMGVYNIIMWSTNKNKDLKADNSLRVRLYITHNCW